METDNNQHTAGSSAATCSAAIVKARRERLWECLQTLSEWTAKRAGKEYNTDTTITMLARKVQETIDSVDKAGWRAAKKFEPNQTGQEPPTEDDQ
jgi:hypothetical protein